MEHTLIVQYGYKHYMGVRGCIAVYKNLKERRGCSGAIPAVHMTSWYGLSEETPVLVRYLVLCYAANAICLLSDQSELVTCSDPGLLK